MTDLFTLLERFGFPAVAFGMMWWMAYKTIRLNTSAINRLGVMVEKLCSK
jgi:hypothetical protein